jgi:hypothetical protein
MPQFLKIVIFRTSRNRANRPVCTLFSLKTAVERWTYLMRIRVDVRRAGDAIMRRSRPRSGFKTTSGLASGRETGLGRCCIKGSDSVTA